MTANSHSLSNSEFFQKACKEVHPHFNRNQDLSGFDFDSLILPLLFQNPLLSKKGENSWVVPESFLNSPFNPSSNFVVVDIETTGGRPPQHRITELAALKMKDGKIVGEFSKLVNPDRSIPRNVVQLTGITEAMVADQPTLDKVLPDFLEFVENCVFVAHNADFDYRFIKYFALEYLGEKYDPEVLCTFKLAKKILPNFSKHNLGELSLIFGYEDLNTIRHRALDDARVTAFILNQLISFSHYAGLRTERDLLLFQEPLIENPPKFAKGISLSESKIEEIPKSKGIFLLQDSGDKTIYLNKSSDIQESVRGIFYPKKIGAKRFVKKLSSVTQIKTIPIMSELGMKLEVFRLSSKYKIPNPLPMVPGGGFLKINIQHENLPLVQASSSLSYRGDFFYGPFRKKSHLDSLLSSIYSVFPLNLFSFDGEKDQGKKSNFLRKMELIERLRIVLEGPLGLLPLEENIAFLLPLWGKKISESKLRKRFERLSLLLNDFSIHGPSVEKRDVIIVEPVQDRFSFVCYFVSQGLLSDNIKFKRNDIPFAELEKKISQTFNSEFEREKNVSKKELFESLIVADWLRRETIEGFVMPIFPNFKKEEIIGKLFSSLKDPFSLGKTIIISST
ncbi:MAG: exonuclease domain-containing protein [Nitrospinota bacterium]|nr:exonuclease domain-containing protein [Nitrospinota bacterium]